MAFAPLLMTAAATAYSAYSKGQADKYNSQVEKGEQSASINQSNAEEGMVRRSGREAEGRQAAAFGSAGVGYGGSSAGALDQTAVNEEMDALNTRYKGNFTGYGYGVQSNLDKQQGNQQNVLAGAALLKGLGSSYNYSPAAQAGLSTPGGSGWDTTVGG